MESDAEKKTFWQNGRVFTLAISLRQLHLVNDSQ